MASVLALAGVLASCSDDDGGDDASSDEPSTTAAPSSDGSTTTAPDADAEPATVRVVLQGDAIQYAGVYVARAKGFFEDENIDVPDPVVVLSGSDGARMMLQNEADVTLQGVEVLGVLETAQSDALKMVGSFQDSLVLAIVGPTSITSIDDLAGKTVALGGQAQPSMALAERFLNDQLGEGNWTPLNLEGGSGARTAAVVAGQADAAVTTTPNDLVLASQDSNFHTIGYTDGLDYVSSGIFMTNSLVEENHDVGVRWMRAYTRAAEFVNDPANKDEVLDILAGVVDIEPDLIAPAYDDFMSGPDATFPKPVPDINRDNLQAMLDVLVDLDLISAAPELDSVIDDSILEESAS